jgi:VIT1/CCC1 family predicted Fe2+/Mn2+ transporter
LEISGELKKTVLKFQKNEMTEYYIYEELSKNEKGVNADIFLRISKDEALHYAHFKKITGVDVGPDKFRVFFYIMLSKIFGLTFAIKLMEGGENSAHRSYTSVLKSLPELKPIVSDEMMHEHELIGMIDEEKLDYLSSMVLAINNSLEELTGVVVGLSFALRDAKLIGFTALITGIAATISMAASEYLSQKAEGGTNASPVKAAVYSGIVYLITVAMIVGPFFIMPNYVHALALSIGDGIVIIFLFSAFMSVVKGMKFKKSFLEVLTITSIVVAISYGIGTAIRLFFLHSGAAGQ